MFEDLFQKLIRKREEAPPVLMEDPLPPLEPSEKRVGIRLPDSGEAMVEWIDTTDEYRREPAKVHDRSKHGIGLWMGVRLSPGWPALIQYRGKTLRGVVRHVKAVEGRWLAGLEVVESERRRADRFPYEFPCSLLWESDAKAREISGMIVDANEGGVQVSTETPIPPDTSVCVRAMGWRRFGTVVYSRSGTGDYRMGVQFAGGLISDDSADYDD